jgi:FkbM family methyltransferase
MERRKFLGKSLSSSFLLGAAGGAAAGVAGTVALAPKLIRPAPLPGKLSYAQQGEDIALWQIMRFVLGIERPTYMDIGAHHPVFNSNTYYFYERESRGVLVEPNPALHGLLEQLRPRDVLVRAGIGVAAQAEADFYIIGGSEDGQLNTFSPEQAKALVTRSSGHYRIERVLKIPLLGINELMRKHWNGPPNLLSLDTEGFDLPILRSLDFERLRPDVICVESVEIGGRRLLTDIMQLMAQKGYEARGGSFVNTIFLDRRHVA